MADDLTPEMDLRHDIVNVSPRGILGGWTHYCSCGAAIIESDGGSDVVGAHLAGPPAPRQPTVRERLSALVVERNQARAEVAQLHAQLDHAATLLEALCADTLPGDHVSIGAIRHVSNQLKGTPGPRKP